MRMTKLLRFSALALALALAAATGAGCDKKNDGGASEAPKKLGAPPAAGASTALDATAKANEYFGQVCVACHGSSGRGDGPGAATLNPKPRNYTDPTWQASVTDAEIAKIISEGGASVGKSAMMPANPGLKPEVIDALVKKIRAFGAPAAGETPPTPAAAPAPAPAAPAPAPAAPTPQTP